MSARAVPPDVETLRSNTKADLKGMCVDLGLRVSGTKDELVQRIVAKHLEMAAEGVVRGPLGEDDEEEAGALDGEVVAPPPVAARGKRKPSAKRRPVAKKVTAKQTKAAAGPQSSQPVANGMELPGHDLAAEGETKAAGEAQPGQPVANGVELPGHDLAAKEETEEAAAEAQPGQPVANGVELPGHDLAAKEETEEVSQSQVAAASPPSQHIANSEAFVASAPVDAAAAEGAPQLRDASPIISSGSSGSTSSSSGTTSSIVPKADKSNERKRRLGTHFAGEHGSAFEKVDPVLGAQYRATAAKAVEKADEHVVKAYVSDNLQMYSERFVNERARAVLGHSGGAMQQVDPDAEPRQEYMEMVGEIGPARQGWCVWWSNEKGIGEVRDSSDHEVSFVLNSGLLTGANVVPRLRYLQHGEMVEYRRVYVDDTGPARAILVRGIKGWPLTCEMDNSRTLNA